MSFGMGTWKNTRIRRELRLRMHVWSVPILRSRRLPTMACIARLSASSNPGSIQMRTTAPIHCAVYAVQFTLLVSRKNALHININIPAPLYAAARPLSLELCICTDELATLIPLQSAQTDGVGKALKSSASCHFIA